MRLTSTKDTKLQFIRAIVYGDSGVGKTTSIRTLPADRTTIILTERGTLALRELDYSVLQIEEWADMKNVYGAFANPDGIEDEDLRTIVNKTKVIVFDGLTDVAALCMKSLIEVDRKALLQERTKKRREAPEGMYPDVMTLEDWKPFRQRMLNLVSAFCHLPFHVIMTCRAEWKIDKESKDTLRMPYLGGGKTGGELPSYFDLVFYMKPITIKTGETTRIWQTYNDGMVVAKDGSGILEPYEETDWIEVFKKIIGDKPKAKKEETAK
jgi:hypothetical protein